MAGLLSALAASPQGGAGSESAAFSASAGRIGQIQADYQRRLTELWMATLQRQRGEASSPVVAPERGDRRFAAAEWRDQPYYDYLKQSYLLTSRYITELV